MGEGPRGTLPDWALSVLEHKSQQALPYGNACHASHSEGGSAGGFMSLQLLDQLGHRDEQVRH